MKDEKKKKRRWHKAKCPHCEVLVINNIVCHEFGCPNQKKAK